MVNEISDVICYSMTMKNMIGIVDDEPRLRETLKSAFEKENYSVKSFEDGSQVIDQIQGLELLILDIIMPKMDGITLLKDIRSKGITIPVIFLTSRDEEFDRIIGLDLGADDYLTKPFSIRELMARVRAVLRRYSKNISSDSKKRVEYGDLMLDTESFIGYFRGQVLSLTVSEFRILESLAAQPGQVRSREQLLQTAYPEDQYFSDRSADCHIKRIRKKLKKLGETENLIETVYGIGYRLKISASAHA
jgi:DNA-binding response OmpR family regulator